MTENNTALKPCPFCGGEARKIIMENGYGSRPMFIIECSVCRIAKQWANLEKVTREWNTRASDQLLDIGRIKP